MANIFRFKRGTTTKRQAYTPVAGEAVIDLNEKKLYYGDGSTVGGIAITGEDDTKIPKIQTLTSAKKYTNLASFYNAGDKVIGAIVIHLPVAMGTRATMLQVKVKGYNYLNGTSAFELLCGFYQYMGSGILSYGAGLLGSFPTDRVRYGRAGDHTVIILGDVDTSWSYPNIHVASAVASYSSFDGWEDGWSITLENNISSYTNIVEATPWGTPRSKTAERLATARTIGLTGGATAAGVSFNGTSDINLSVTALDASKLSGTASIDTTGNAGTAAKLQNIRSISATGDAAWSVSFDGSAAVSGTLTLSNSGVTAGTYKSVTVDAKGRVTAGANVVTSLVTSTSATGTTNAATTNTNTFLNIVEKVGTANASPGTSTQVTGAGTVTVTSDTAGKLTITGAQSITGNAATATKLATARTINGVGFDGTANITIGEPTFGNPLANYSSGDANALNTGGFNVRYLNQTATNKPTGTDHAVMTLNYSTIWSAQQAFDWRTGDVFTRTQNNGTWSNWNTHITSANISLQTVASAAKLQTPRTINGVSFDGTANITVADGTKLPLAGGTITGALTVSGLLTANGGFKGNYVTTDNRALKPSATPKGSFGAYFTSQGGLTGTANAVYGDLLTLNSYSDTSGGLANALFVSKNSKSILHYQAAQGATTWGTPSQLAYVTDNVASATKLQTPRTINGVPFDGTSDINIQHVAIRIPGNSDLNNYQTPGIYYCDTDAETTSTANTPINYSYSLVVTRTAGVNQIFTAYNGGNNAVYVRGYYSSTWSPWKKLAFTGDSITGNAASASKLQTPRKINGVDFDGSGDISIPLTQVTGQPGTILSEFYISFGPGELFLAYAEAETTSHRLQWRKRPDSNHCYDWTKLFPEIGTTTGLLAVRAYSYPGSNAIGNKSATFTVTGYAEDVENIWVDVTSNVAIRPVSQYFVPFRTGYPKIEMISGIPITGIDVGGTYVTLAESLPNGTVPWGVVGNPYRGTNEPIPYHIKYNLRYPNRIYFYKYELSLSYSGGTANVTYATIDTTPSGLPTAQGCQFIIRIYY